ncbi:MAG: lysophospholipid acyltransferase family protein [Solirubrobacterales bacterium]
MRTIYFYFSFGLYMVYSFFLKLKLDHIIKTKSKEAGEEYLDQCLKNWADFCLKRAGIKITTYGKENLPDGNCLFVSNHQGYFDIPGIISATGRAMGFIAKKEMINYIIVNYWMEKIHCVFMDRDNVRESMKAINQGADYLKDGYNIAIFPEGTRSKGENLGEFKKGSMKLGIKSGVPIVPVAINGTYKAREANNGAIKPADVKITICKPIYVSELTKEEQSNLSEIVKGIIEKNI